MAKIHTLEIKNFRAINTLKYQFDSNFNCIIGRGDSGKSTILEAIASVLSPTWNLPFFDNDFFDCDTKSPIIIEATIIDFPDELIKEEKFALYQRGLTKKNEITDVIEEAVIPALTIRLEVQKDLEPKWYVVTERDSAQKEISANDRAKLNSFLVSDYIDRHFTWTKGGPLYTLLKQENPLEEDESVMIDALREAKSKIDTGSFSKFDSVIGKIKATAASYGLNISKTNTTIDYKEILIKDGKVSLHDEAIPFRLKGKGSKRLISMAIQASLANTGGIILIDEIEQGLEPDRVQNLVNTLKNRDQGQVFITTHSRDVLVELSAENILLIKKGDTSLRGFRSDLQGLIRSNPEALFANKVIVCEGATELGLMKAFNEYRISKGEQNMAYLGVRTANGGGEVMGKYCEGLIETGFPTFLFCDSDDKEFNKKKQGLIDKGVYVLDWSDTDSLEITIFKCAPFNLVQEAFHLASKIKHEEESDVLPAEHGKNMWAAVKARYKGSSFPVDFTLALDEIELRAAIGLTAQKNSWFKRQDKSYKLGVLLFAHYSEFDISVFTERMEQLSLWIGE